MKTINSKRLVVLFFCIVLLLAFLLTGCINGKTSDDDGNESTTEDTTQTNAPLPTYDDFEPATDEEGSALTTIVYDDEGNSTPYRVYEQKQNSNTQNETTPEDEDPSTYVVSPTEENGEISPVNKIAEILNSGNYRFAGYMPANDGEDPTKMDIMVCGTNMRITTDMDGISIEIRIINNAMYMVNPEKKTYAELSSTIMKTMGLNIDDLNVSELSDALSKGFNTTKNPAASPANLDGKSVTRYTYDLSDGGRTNLYLDGEKPIKMEKINADGSTTEYIIEVLEGGITMDDINIQSDLQKQNIASFIVGLMPS